MTFHRSVAHLAMIVFALIISVASAQTNEETVRIFSMDGTTQDAAIDCAAETTCLPWQVYKMKIVAGPEKGRIFYAAERSAKKKPRWKFKNKEILISEIENKELAEQLGAEYFIK